MEHVAFADREAHNNSDRCVAYEYTTTDSAINGAVVEMEGRYPDKGLVVNHDVTEMLYILDGSGKVIVNGDEQPLHSGDVVIIKPGERYWYEGTLKVFAACTPPWTPEQHENFTDWMF